MLDNFKVGDTVTLTGVNKRGSTRINNFGPKFKVKSFALPGVENTRGCILFESVEKKFRIGEHLTTWSGWLSLGEEVIVDAVCNDI